MPHLSGLAQGGFTVISRALLSRRNVLATVATVCVALGVLVFCGVPARAALTHPFTGDSFGPSGLGSGAFGDVKSVAVDQSSGDVYVFDPGKEAIYKFDAAGEPVDFSASGTNAITGVASVGGGAEQEIAVDGSSGPAGGDIYLANNNVVEIYSPAGLKLGELTGGEGEEGEEACGVAVDPTGAVYVGFYPSTVKKYVPVTNPVGNDDYTESLLGAQGVCNVAADSAGDLYAATYSGGVRKYEALQFGSLAATGTLVDEFGDTLAVDPMSDHVYIDEGSRVAEYDSSGGLITYSGIGSLSGSEGVAVKGGGDLYEADGSGRVAIFGPLSLVPDVATQSASAVTDGTATLNGSVDPDEVPVGTCQFEYRTQAESSYGHMVTCASAPGSGDAPVEVSAALSGLAANTIYHYRLSAANTNGVSRGADETFTTSGSPAVVDESIEGTAQTTATLGAQIDPDGHDTDYHFEYGTTTAYGEDVPVPDGEIGSGQVAVPVSAHLAGLEPGTIYHYRVVATNATGTTHGKDETLTTYAVQQQADVCANEARREEQNATYLPDCRAYEMVSPLDKNGSDIIGSKLTTESSSDGERVAYAALAGIGDTNGSGAGGYTQYIASRNAEAGWTSRAITPLVSQGAYQTTVGPAVAAAFSEDLSQAVVESYVLPGTPGAVPKEVNLYDETTATGSLQILTTPLTGAPVELLALNKSLRGSSSDLGVVTFETGADLLPQATGSEPKLYASNHGALTLAGILPNGTPPAGGSGSAGAREDTPENIGTVSSDGSRIAFVAPVSGSGEPQLYLRRDGTSTAWVSEPETSTPDPEPKNVRFQAMSADGRKVLFTSGSPLVDSDPGGGGVGLYMYTDGPSPEHEANLTFIARIPDEPGKVVSAISENAERIYFFAGGTYLWDNGTIHFVAATAHPLLPTALDNDDGTVLTVEASAEGRQLAFLSGEDLTAEAAGSKAVKMYVYDEKGGTLRCVSCGPTGTPTSSNAEIEPKATHEAITVSLPIKPRFISNDGRYVFFSTEDPLVARDTNGLSDVYEYDTLTGEVALLSSGTGQYGAWFAASGGDGNDVFMVTREQEVGPDTDSLVDLYDVRAGGGFPEPKPETGGCVGDECQGVPTAAPSFNTASGFSGLGNVAAPASKASGSKASGKSKRKTLTRAQKLSRALKACKREPRKARERCGAKARRRYGAKQAGNSTSNRARR
jgi:hypothetical protein